MIVTIAIAVTIFCLAGLLLAPLVLEPSPEAKRVLDVIGQGRDADAAYEQVSASGQILKLSGTLRQRLGFAENKKSKKRLQQAGFRGAAAGDLFFAVQCLLPLLGVVAGSFITVSTLYWVFTFGLVGFIAPDFWLSRRITKRRNQLRRSMPDTVDLLVICVDAGLGLDQAILRVSDELAISHPHMHQELIQVMLEQRAGQPRVEAWQNLAARNDLEEFTAFANMLMQTDRFGTPIIKALTRFSDDLRQGRRQRAEEQAAKTKIKIIFPLVLCIFPCLFLVLLAPAIFGIMKELGGIGK